MHTMSSKMIRSVMVAAMACLLSPLATLSIASEGVKVRVVGTVTTDESMGWLKQPSGLFYDESKKRLYIADSSNKRIVSLDSNLKYLADLSRDEVVLPIGVVKDSKGIFYVVDAEAAGVFVCDIKKEHAEPLQLTGVPQGVDIFVPGRIAIDKEDRLYIIDKLNNRILIVDTSGSFVRSLTIKGGDFSGFTDIRVDDEGYAYALDTVNGKVHVFDNKGTVVSSFGDRSKDRFLFPTSLAVGKNGLVYVLDGHGGRILVFNRAGGVQYAISKKGVKEGELSNPSYIWVDESSNIYIIDGNRIQVLKEERE